jgi:hypothetical protein
MIALLLGDYYDSSEVVPGDRTCGSEIGWWFITPLMSDDARRTWSQNASPGFQSIRKHK